MRLDMACNRERTCDMGVTGHVRSAHSVQTRYCCVRSIGCLNVEGNGEDGDGGGGGSGNVCSDRTCTDRSCADAAGHRRSSNPP